MGCKRALAHTGLLFPDTNHITCFSTEWPAEPAIRRKKPQLREGAVPENACSDKARRPPFYYEFTTCQREPANRQVLS